MPATPEPYYAAATKVLDLGHDLKESCPQAAIILLTLAACMEVAPIDGQPIRTLVLASTAVAELLMATCQANIRQLREIAESN